MSAATIEALDLSDLGLLDDTDSHIACGDCNPGGAGPAVGLCGKEFFAQGVDVHWDEDPGITCAECNELFPVCPRCGQ